MEYCMECKYCENGICTRRHFYRDGEGYMTPCKFLGDDKNTCNHDGIDLYEPEN